jgi:hypothetical protein
MPGMEIAAPTDGHQQRVRRIAELLFILDSSFFSWV